MQDGLAGGLFDPEPSPAQKAALERLEVTLALVEGWVDEVVSPGHRRADARRRQAAGDRTPPARRRRPGRADLRHAGRPRAAAAPAPRRVHAVGLAAHPPGRRGPRRRLDVTPPAAHRRRPRRPAGLPRGLGDAGRALRRGLRRRAARPARRRRPTPTTPSPPSDAPRRRRSPRCGLGAADARRRRALRDRYVAHLARAPRRPAEGVLPRPPDRRRDRRAPPTATRCSSTTTARPTRGSPSAATSSPATPTLAGGGRRELRRGVRADRPSTSTRCRCPSTSTRWSSAPTAAPCTTSTCGSSPLPTPDAAHAVSEESLDVRWWPVDALPATFDDMYGLSTPRSRGCAVSLGQSSSTPGGGSRRAAAD